MFVRTSRLMTSVESVRFDTNTLGRRVDYVTLRSYDGETIRRSKVVDWIKTLNLRSTGMARHIKMTTPEEALHALEWNRSIAPEHSLRFMRLPDSRWNDSITTQLEMERLERHPTNWSQIM